MKVPRLEHRSLRRRAAEFDRERRRQKARLIQWAQAGNPAALAELRDTYGLSLPLVEERSKSKA
jgi:hypothetical protein